MSDNVPSAEQQGTGRADEEEADESIFSTGRMDRMELEHRLVIEKAKHLNDLRAEQLKVAKLEVERAELKARVERMEMQNQIDELKAKLLVDKQAATSAAADPPAAGQVSSNNNNSVGDREETANSLLTAMHEMGKRVEKVEARLTSFAEGQRLQSAEMIKMGDKLMVAKQEKEQLHNEFREKIQQQADKLAEHSIELSDLKKKERLNEWLSGIVLIRTGTFLRVVLNQHLVTSAGRWSIHAGGLIAKEIAGFSWVHVHADRPFPVVHAAPEEKLLYYFEVTFTEMRGCAFIGLCGTDFPFNSTTTHVGKEASSFAIDDYGLYYASGKITNMLDSFDNGDVVGCGLLVLPAGRRLFFTKNGDLLVKPILLGAGDANANLHPIVSADPTLGAYNSGIEVEFNFGADLAAKPFKYKLSQLDVMDV